jgi:Rieske Fe-S protein
VVGISSTLGTLDGCSSSPAAPEAFGDVSAGNVSDTSIGMVQALSDAPAILGRDENGLYAMTSTCTHEGCDMIHDGSVTSSGISCSCHGSRFDLNGNVTNGPASAPLQHFAVSIDASGAITVHGGMDVSASTRVAVPA